MRFQPSRCSALVGPKRAECKEKYAEDYVLVSVHVPSLSVFISKETPAMDVRTEDRCIIQFNKFIAYLGGLLGVLMGVSIICVIKFAVLVVKVALVFCSK